MGATRVNVSGAGIANRNDRFWGEVGLGGSYSWSEDRFRVFAEVSAKSSLENFGDSYSFGAMVGLRAGF